MEIHDHYIMRRMQCQAICNVFLVFKVPIEKWIKWVHYINYYESMILYVGVPSDSNVKGIL